MKDDVKVVCTDGGSYTVAEWVNWANNQMRRAARLLELIEVGAELPQDNYYTKGLDLCADTGEALLKELKK